MNIKDVVELRDRLRAELETVEKFLEIAKRMEPSVKADLSVTPAAPRVDTMQPKLPGVVVSGDNEYGKISKVVDQALSLCDTQFTVRDVEACVFKLGHRLERSQIATTLSRYKETGKLVIVKDRSGNVPAIYERASNSYERAHGKAA